MANWLEKLRRFVDGEDEADSGANQILAERSKSAGRSKSELFLQKLFEATEAVLREEMTRLPNTKKTYVPASFVIFLSEAENRELRQDKRDFFAESLGALIHERAQEIAGSLELTAKKIKIELRVDGSLPDGVLEVRAYSGDLERTREFKTGELEKVKEIIAEEKRKSFESEKSADTLKFEEDQSNTIDDDILGTIDDFDTGFGIFYRVEIWQAGKNLNEFPIISRKITVGRDGGSKIPNLKLQTDNQKISGHHAEISLAPDGEILVTGLHRKNPTIVDGKRLSNGEQAKLGADKTIEIYDFVLKLKFGE